ncbi:MAG: class I SAM-dependent methyltransferase [Oligoflexia bacterium]
MAHRVFGWAPVEINASWGLNSIRQGMAYSICNTLECPECRLLFLDIRFDDSEMAALYSGYRGEEYTSLREHYEPGYRARNATLASGVNYIPQVEKFLGQWLPERPRVLDWGGDSGKNTPFRAQASVLDIYDISAQPVVEGARSVTREDAANNSYDLIVSSHVLEHVPYPRNHLLEIKEMMKEGTVLYVETPLEELVRLNPERSSLASLKRHWHEHINFYSEKSLSKMAQSCGFEVLEVACLPVSGHGLSWSVLQMACRIKI